MKSTAQADFLFQSLEDLQRQTNLSKLTEKICCDEGVQNIINTLNSFFFCRDKIQQAFNAIKRALAKANILGNFNPEAMMILEVDASPIGVGAVLKQNWKGYISTIAFKSRKL